MTTMTYEEALSYIHAVSWRGSKPGLERITELMERLGNPQNFLRFVHVAGTNGKGSVCAMTAAVLREAGYRTGLFTSPYVRRFNDRIMIDGEEISDAELASFVSEVRPYADSMADPPTEFELNTAIGILYFYRKKCDVVVFETGMGGLMDSTNVIPPPLVSVITGIDYDHMALLGSTIEKIAAEKAGIIKEGSPVVFGGFKAEALPVIKNAAEAAHAPLHIPDYSNIKNLRCSIDGIEFDYDRLSGIRIPLAGLYQPYNAAVALETLRVLRGRSLTIPDEAIKQGLSKTVWHARFEVLSKNPYVIYDGGHNPQGVAACAETVRTYFPDAKVNLLTGIMRDKDRESMVSLLSPIAETVYTVTPPNERSLKSSEYAALFREKGNRVKAYDDFEEGVSAALAESKAENKPLLAAGSLYSYEKFMEVFEKYQRDTK